MTNIPTTIVEPPAGREIATLAGGCFWCTDAIYAQLKGVTKVVSGYTGGTVPNPSYEQVCSGDTGHAEATQITFDPMVITFRDLVRIFFTVHDPTTKNRQGADIGTQYRSGIFYHTPTQLAIAKQVITDINMAQIWGDKPVVTELTEFANFYPAESYHQEYYARNPNQGYCRVVIAPKVVKFREKYREFLR